MGEFVNVSVDDAGVATIRLDRAPVNALSMQVWSELVEAADRCERDGEIGAVVVWGGPRVFAAGADIKEMQHQSFQQFFASGGRLQESLTRLQRLPKVTIAAINGYALGGGCELTMACDFRYAADNAQLGQPEILLGLIPGAGGTQRLTRLVGIAKAKEMVFSGDLYSAVDCHAMGLVDRVLPAEEVYDRAVEAAARYAKGPYALRMAKKAIDEGAELDLDSALRLESTLFAATFATEDRRIGIESFLANGPGKASFTRN